jgi:hypothetical protein
VIYSGSAGVSLMVTRARTVLFRCDNQNKN